MGYITAEHLNYYYPEQDFPALNDVSFSLNQGEIFLLLGRSGSGKSTLGKAIAGTVPYFYGGKIAGKISIDGVSLETMEHDRRSRTVSMVFQYPEKQLIFNKVHREIAFGLENIGAPEETIRRRVFEAMQFTGITPLADEEIDTLSGGQKQRVAITSVLAFFPKCIVFDEPISQLDPLAAEEILNLIKKINEELGITVILIEQRTGKCFEIADKVGFIDEGKLDFFGTPSEFLASDDKRFEPFFPETTQLFKKLGASDLPLGLKASKKRIKDFSLSPKRTAEIPAPNVNESVFTIKNLSCGYNEKTVIRDFSSKVRKGECISLLGANGAGKTTLLKTLMGLKKYRGSILLREKELSKLKQKEVARTVGYVSQNPDDYLTQETVFDELLFTARHLNVENAEKKVHTVLELLELSSYKDRSPKDLSGGQKQRVAIGSALVASPDILILDEPTRGIDTPLKQAFIKLLRELNRKGVTILLVTHDVEFACAVSNRFWILYRGELLADGTKENVFTNGLYYTTAIHKLCKELDPTLFTLEEALGRFSESEGEL